jgi:hypothetical protein
MVIHLHSFTPFCFACGNPKKKKKRLGSVMFTNVTALHLMSLLHSVMAPFIVELETFPNPFPFFSVKMKGLEVSYKKHIGQSKDTTDILLYPKHLMSQYEFANNHVP